MPYNSYFPQYYPQQTQQNNVVPQMQTSFVNVRSELEARNYPVGYGNSITFKDETQPYVYTKTMGFSQLDRPVFEKYRLVKEDVDPPTVPSSSNADPNEYVTKTEFEALQDELKALQKRVSDLRKELGDDESKDNSNAGTA